MRLDTLIALHRGGRSNVTLAREVGVSVSKVQQWATNDPMKRFPDPAHLVGLADTLAVDLLTVLLACCESLGGPIAARAEQDAKGLPTPRERPADTVILDGFYAILRERAARPLSPLR